MLKLAGQVGRVVAKVVVVLMFLMMTTIVIALIDEFNGLHPALSAAQTIHNGALSATGVGVLALIQWLWKR